MYAHKYLTKYLSWSEGRSDPTWIEEPTLQKEAISREALAMSGCQVAGQPGNNLKGVGKSDDREGKAMPENGEEMIMLSQRLIGPSETEMCQILLFRLLFLSVESCCARIWCLYMCMNSVVLHA